MKPRYTLKRLRHEDLPDDITDQKKGWLWVVENHHGAAYWNNVTGEFCWISNEGNANLSELTP